MGDPKNHNSCTAQQWPSAAQDHACKVKRSMVAKDLKRMRTGDKPSEEKWRVQKNAERDLSSHFVRIGLSLPIKIRQFEHTLSDGQSLTTDYINPSDWLTLLLKRYPQLIAGGSATLEDQLQGFWEAYRLQHGQHEVFTKQCSLGQVIPLCFWGDEGRGPRRTHYMEATIEVPLGLSEQKINCSCCDKFCSLPTHWLPPAPEQIDDLTPKMALIDDLGTNYYGHSFLKRYYLFGLPGYQYENEPAIVEEHLNLVAKDLVTLFNDGVDICGKRYFGALVGSKGDMKWQAKQVAWMDRSYINLGTKNDIPICSLCLAGHQHVPMEDVQLEPMWQNTLFVERPWTYEPVMLKVPFDPAKPEYLYKLDSFHSFKVGLGRDLAGSSLVWLCNLEIFDFPGSSQNIDDRLSRCYAQFKLWALTECYTPSLRKKVSPKHFSTVRHHGIQHGAIRRGATL